MTDQTQSTALTALPPADRAMIALDSKSTEARLHELVKETADIQSVIDPAGREQAHRAGMRLKNTRVAIEKTGKTARDDAQAFSRAVIAEEKRLIALIEPEEKRVLGLRDDFDAKVAAEKSEAERRERERVAAICTKIDAIRQIPATMVGEPADEIMREYDAIAAFDICDGSFAEFQSEAMDAINAALAALQNLHQQTLAREAEAARLAAERAEIERQRAEREAEEARLKAEREQFEDERRAFMLAQAQARREEEQRAAEEAAAEEQRMRDLDAYDAAEQVAVEIAQLEAAGFDTAPLFSVTAELDESAPAQPWMHGNMVFDICYYTGLQLRTLAKKADAIGKSDFAELLIAAAAELESGDLKESVAQADLVELYQADVELVQHARDGQNAIQIHLFADAGAA